MNFTSLWRGLIEEVSSDMLILAARLGQQQSIWAIDMSLYM